MRALGVGGRCSCLALGSSFLGAPPNPSGTDDFEWTITILGLPKLPANPLLSHHPFSPPSSGENPTPRSKELVAGLPRTATTYLVDTSKFGVEVKAAPDGF